ncbi:MAG: hypothetical protein KAT28_03425 [Candidatus Aenigmarchaeota archaeon]|nr:hypothetical protein [Candidatus Aenigmarchaeota archaeon]
MTEAESYLKTFRQEEALYGLRAMNNYLNLLESQIYRRSYLKGLFKK